jgi:hypothetical protein
VFSGGCCFPLVFHWQVLRTRSAATLNPLMAASGACNGAFWLAYGLALRDPCVSVPNGVGVALNVLSLAAVAAFGRGPPLPRPRNLASNP